jgi:hypothetical protein
MVELIVLCVVGALIVFGWIAICIDCQKDVVKGLVMAIGLPFMVISILGLFIYVGYCFVTVIN